MFLVLLAGLRAHPQALGVAPLERHACAAHPAEALGGNARHIMLRHLIPNALSPLIVAFTFGMSGAMTLEASLSFLGLGTPPPAPEWGAMLSAGRNFVSNAPWMITIPAGFLVATVLSITVIGRELRRRAEGRLP